MDRQVKIQQLFNDMRTAERNKDLDPTTYYKARAAYYLASEGDSWIKTETAKLEIEASVQTNSWLNQYKDLQALRDSHRDNLDAIRMAETNQASVQNNISYAVRELRKIIQNDEDTSTLANRKLALTTFSQGYPLWVLTVLDSLIVLLLIYACYKLYKLYQNYRIIARQANIGRNAIIASNFYGNLFKSPAL